MPDACVQVKHARCFKHQLQGDLRKSKRTMQLGRYSTIQVAMQEQFKGDEEADEARLADQGHADNAYDQTEADAEGTEEEEGSQDEDAPEDEDSLEDQDQLALSDAEGDIGAC
jgi:hypothetical protein